MTDRKMLVKVKKCHGICYRLVGLRLGYFERAEIVRGWSSTELDTMINHGLTAGLEEPGKISDMPMMGAIINPLMQNGARMEEAWLCTSTQYEEGKKDLIDRMSAYYERVSENTPEAEPVERNQWDKHNALDVDASPLMKAERELQRYMAWNHSQYLPKK